MSLLPQKRRRLDSNLSCTGSTSSTSTKNPYFTLEILSDRNLDCLVQEESEVYERTRTPISFGKIDEFISSPFFQDNTEFFDLAVTLDDLVLVVFPPGSGKTTTALLFKALFSSSETWSETKRTFFNHCNFVKNHRSKYDEYLRSTKIVYLTFERIDALDRRSFEASFIGIMLSAMRESLDSDEYREEKRYMKADPRRVYSSLLEFATALKDKYSNKKIIILLDSCDTMYNVIAQLPESTDDEKMSLCRSFTNFLQSPVTGDSTNVTVFSFGVSPFLSQQLSGKARIYDIGNDSNDVSKFFSYSEKTIQQAIRTAEIDSQVTLEECKKIAGFMYDDKPFINPGICVSYLNSIAAERNWFQINITPRSLWLTQIFTVDDLELLIDILEKPCEREFSMNVSIMEMLSQEKRDRRVFYPLFIYGGFVSCKKIGKKKYQLSCANQVSKCILNKTLNDIYMDVFKRSYEDCVDIYKMVLEGRWQEFCDLMSDILGPVSPINFSSEKDYHNFVFGLLGPAKKKYNVSIKCNVALAGMYPDLSVVESVGSQTTASVWELKLIKPKDFRSHLKKDSLKDYYTYCNMSENHKSSLIKEMKKEILDAKTQIIQYASSEAVAQKCNSVKCFVVIFYLNHVLMLVNEHRFQDRSEATLSTSDWIPYFSNGFFSKDDMEELCK